MIEKALYQHLQSQAVLAPFLTRYGEAMAIFSQEAPSDEDPLWQPGPQYGRLVFSVNIQGDPARTMGGTLVVDILCQEGQQLPEEMEPIVRQLIDGYFFSAGLDTMAAQFQSSEYFNEPKGEVIGVTMVFALLAFPMLTTSNPDVIARINQWTAEIHGLHVINYDPLPSQAWKPVGDQSAVYWRLWQEGPAGWIPDTFQTIWRTASLKCHVFSETVATAARVTDDLVIRLSAAKRLIQAGQAPILVSQKNTAEYGADPLRTGQLTVEATYGVVVRFQPEDTLVHLKMKDKKGAT